MTRELRLGAAGILFYLILAANLLASGVSQDFLRNLPSPSGTSEITAILGLGAVLFTSNAIGYLFGSIFIYWWNLPRGRQGNRGYSAEWQKLSYDLKGRVIEQYQAASRGIHNASHHSKFESKWQLYSADVFLTYFWQRAPREIVDWVVRRHTAFFAGMSTAIGIGLAVILSTIVIIAGNMGWTIINTGIMAISSMVVLMVYRNAQCARTEAWQMIDLWLANIFNLSLASILNQIQTDNNSINGSTDMAREQEGIL